MHYKIFYCCFFGAFLFLFLSINFVSSSSINKIIRLGDNNFRYIHFSYFSNGDMIVDTSCYPISQERRFFGLKTNGRFFFNSTDNEEIPYCSINVDHDEGRIEGESYRITIKSDNNDYNGKEVILGISKAGDEVHYVEIYDLENGSLMAKYLTTEIFGNIYSDYFSISKSPDESDNVYTIAYVEKKPDNLYIEIRKTYFIFDTSLTYFHKTNFEIQTGDQRTLSCFYTQVTPAILFYLCYYLSADALHLRVRAYSPVFVEQAKSTIYDAPSVYGGTTFLKGILFKNNIGVFTYYKIDKSYPTISFLKCEVGGNMTAYNDFGEINLDKEIDFNKNVNFNDIIKLNDIQICYISINGEDKTKFKIIIFTLYKNDELMNIRYYNNEMWNNYGVRIFLNLKADLYKNFIALGFSNCPQYECFWSDRDTHYSSLIIFSYPNSADNNLNIISYLYITDEKIENGIKINLEEKLVIENNIFGYIFKGTKIMNFPTGIYLKNMTNGNIIEDGTIILNGEYIFIYFEGSEEYAKKNYTFEFAYILEEDNYENLNNNLNMTSYDYSRGSDKGEDKNEKNYYTKNEYIGKYSYFNIIINDDLISDCNNDLCDLCLINYTCITCKYNRTFIGNMKKCISPFNPTTIITTIPTTIITTVIESTIKENNIFIPPPIISTIPKITNTSQNQDCTDEDILAKKCSGKMTNEQIEEIYNELKKKISANSNEIIETENVIFQISTLEEQKKSNNPNISSIDLKECEKLLKDQEGLKENEELIVFKTDIKSEDLSKTYVQYEIYNPKTLKNVSMYVCRDISISVSVPITLDENTKAIYASMSQSGYNLFDLNDSFYNDICSTYTTENGTDLTLVDRKNLIFDNSGNISMCQDGCTFESYNLTTRKAQCDCSIQIEETITDPSQINFNQKLVDTFYSTLKNSNFLVLKCFKLVFSLKGQTNNIGSYLMSGITFIFIVLMFVYIINGNKKLNTFIQAILEQKINNNKRASQQLELKNNKKIIEINVKKNNKNIQKKDKIKNNKNINNNKISVKKQKSLKNKNQNDKHSKSIKNENAKHSKNIKKEKDKNSKNIKKEKGKKAKNFPPKKSKDLDHIYNRKTYDNLVSFDRQTQDNFKNTKKIVKIKSKNKNIFNIKNNIQIIHKSNTAKSIENLKTTKMNLDKQEIKKLTDEELNSLEYEHAIIIDKRTYFQYYFSLLKKKQLILFAFWPANDYNLIAVKISLLLLAFSLYFTINGFFFSDSTMNKINEEKGAFNLILQIPPILYSACISAIINMILKILSLSEKQILLIKSEKNYLIAKKKSNSIKTCLRIKLSIFFILSFIFMLFFWYFISCFCAVYKNTQKILITDTLISFGFSMLYPFGLNLLPGIFRIPSLRAAKRDKKCIYKISGFVALI